MCMPRSRSHRCTLSALFRNILFFFLLPFYYCALSLPHLSFVLCSVCVWGPLSRPKPKNPKKNNQFSWKKRCVQILKSSRQITMTVRGPTSLHGFEPPASASDIFKSSPMTGALLSPPSRQTCSWMDKHGRPASPPYDFEGRRSDRRERCVNLIVCAIKENPLMITFLNRVRRVELVIEPGQSLGLMIRGGIEYGLGIYVTGVDKDSVADRAGLNVSNKKRSVSFIHSND